MRSATIAIVVLVAACPSGSAEAFGSHRLVLTIGPGAPFTASSGRWSLVGGSAAPPACGGGMTYDVADSFVFLYTSGSAATHGPSGACTGPPTVWSYSHGVWAPLPGSNAPPARLGPAIAYDALDGYVLLFGGIDPNGRYLGDTWGYHGGAWTNLTSGVSPPARDDAAIAYSDADHAVVLYGGFGVRPAGAPAPLSDTWEYHAGVWSAQSPSSAPPVRDRAPMTYDAPASTTILFGGTDDAFASGCCVPRSETWGFASGTWTNLTTQSSPVPRLSPGIAFDPAASAVILFGGASPSFLADTWAYAGGVWTPVITGSGPSSRAEPLLAYDVVDGYVLLFGGAGATPTNDSWAFGPGSSAPGRSDGSTLVWIAGVGGATVGIVAAWWRLRPTPRRPA